MYYVKFEVAEGVTIRSEITDENVYCTCPKCGAEVRVDLADVVTEDGLDLYGTAIFCESCSKAVRAEQAESAACAEARSSVRSADYFDNVTTAMEALQNVWAADGIGPKERMVRLQRALREFIPELPPQAFPKEED